MGKTLLKKITGSKNKNAAIPVLSSIEDNNALHELMQEMKAHLNDAAKDMLQPRPEIVNNLLKKVLH